MKVMNDTHALITGGTRGIGLAIARAFVEAGAHVTICSRKAENVEAAQSELGHPEAVHAVAAHVGQTDQIDQLLASANERFGPVGVLVNNAGTNPYFGPIVDAEEWAWDKTMDVNLKAPFLLSRDVGRQMTAHGGGSIVNIASIAGIQASPNQGIYSVSKAGLIMLTKVLARELGAGGVRVNCILPGLIKTELSRALWNNEEILQAVTASKSLGRIGDVTEVVGAALYFASEASSFTTGAVLQVDGGMVI